MSGLQTIVLTSGTSWSRPANCPNILTSVECWGGGAPGIDADSAVCAGGGGGAYSVKLNYSIGNQSSIAIQIPGSTTYNNNPVDTWFDNSSTGILAKSGSGQNGGVAASCVGTTAYSGGQGGNGAVYGGGGGGGSATKNSNGNNGTNGGAIAGGTGGNAGTGGGSGGTAPRGAGTSNVEGGGGGGGNEYYNTGTSGAGGAPGGGGGGSDYGYGSSGAGARGQIRITYYPRTGVISSHLLTLCN